MPDFRSFVFVVGHGISADAMNKELLTDASTRGIRYFESLAERPVAPTAAAIEQLRGLDEPLPNQEGNPAETLRLLDEIGHADVDRSVAAMIRIARGQN